MANARWSAGDVRYLGIPLRGARAAVVGIGVENTPLVEFLARHGAQVTACDGKEADALEAYRRLGSLPVHWSLGPGYLEPLVREAFDFVFLTPGLIKDRPEIKAAKARGARITGQVDLFLSLCPAPVIGITGSSGKSTTTSLLGDILAAGGAPVHVGGNIGRVLLPDLPAIEAGHQVVLELSSFQLELVHRSPQTAVLLNIRPNHLDIHGSFEAYREAKANIARHQGPDDFFVFAAHEPEAAAVAGQTPARLVAFGPEPPVPPPDAPADHWSRRLRGWAAVVDGQIVFQRGGEREVIMPVAEVPLMGRHNLANVLAAVAVGRLRGIDPAAMAGAITAFRPLEHRLEPVVTWRGVEFYNDSVATAPDRTAAALAAFDRPIVLLAGGYDKGIPFNGLGRHILARPVRAVVLLGDTAGAIAEAIAAAARAAGKEAPPVLMAGDLAEAVRLGAEAARPGDVVLFSPACSSYDMFPSFAVRGRRFKEEVKKLAAS